MEQNSPEKKEAPKHEIKCKNGAMITVQETEKGIFKVIGVNVTNDDKPDWGFVDWDEVVTFSDYSNPNYDYTNVADFLDWEDVMLSTMGGIKAPSIERVKEALKHVGIAAHNAADI